MAEVVYLNPTWAQLTYQFSQSVGGWEKIQVHSGHGQIKIGTHLMDEKIYDLWRSFYIKHALPALALKGEGARRPRSDESAWTP